MPETHLWIESSLGWIPRGILRYISDAEVERPLLGLKFAAWEIFWVTNFLVVFFFFLSFFLRKILASTFLGFVCFYCFHA